jgi:hypothetical protein
LQRALKTDGYAIVRNVLRPEEVRFLRFAAKTYLHASRCYDYGGKFELVEWTKIPDIEAIVVSDSVRRHLARATEPFAFGLTGICDLSLNTTSQWHKDITHFTDMDGHVATDEAFRFYKIAFYLQDQDEVSRATLRVRPGSHLSRDLTDLPEKKAVVSAGDMIIFDVRIDHLGQLTTLTDRLLRVSFAAAGARLNFDAQKAFARSRSAVRWMRPGVSDRVAIFMTFGPCGTGARAGAARGEAPVAGRRPSAA